MALRRLGRTSLQERGETCVIRRGPSDGRVRLGASCAVAEPTCSASVGGEPPEPTRTPHPAWPCRNEPDGPKLQAADVWSAAGRTPNSVGAGHVENMSKKRRTCRKRRGCRNLRGNELCQSELPRGSWPPVHWCNPISPARQRPINRPPAARQPPPNRPPTHGPCFRVLGAGTVLRLAVCGPSSNFAGVGQLPVLIPLCVPAVARNRGV
jgi:hypothetical protein